MVKQQVSEFINVHLDGCLDWIPITELKRRIKESSVLVWMLRLFQMHKYLFELQDQIFFL